MLPLQQLKTRESEWKHVRNFVPRVHELHFSGEFAHAEDFHLEFAPRTENESSVLIRALKTNDCHRLSSERFYENLRKSHLKDFACSHK